MQMSTALLLYPVLRDTRSSVCSSFVSCAALLALCRAALGRTPWCPAEKVPEGLETVPVHQAPECFPPLPTPREAEVLQHVAPK